MREVEQRIRNIENGLVEFTAPMDMFQPDSIKAKDRKTLSERMAHYKVPGVSIAVINDNEIDWAKGYGVTKAGSDTPVTTETVFEAAFTDDSPSPSLMTILLPSIVTVSSSTSTEASTNIISCSAMSNLLRFQMQLLDRN